MTASQTDQVETLQQRLDEATRRAESLRRVIESISGELALEPLLTRIIQRAVELIGADDGAIGLVIEKPEGPVVRTIATYNLPTIDSSNEIGLGFGLSGLVLQAQCPIRLDRYGDLTHPALPDRDDYAVIGMPIWWADQMIGFFGIGAAPPRRFDDQDVETLELFARHAAIAIENAQRYERERRRTEQLTLIARIRHTLTADLPLDELLQSAADAIHELLGYPNIGIPLIDPADPATMVIGIFGGQFRSTVGGEHRQPISEGIMGAAVQTRHVQLVNDVAADPRYILPPGAADICAELAVPLLSGDQVLGVLNVESGERFSEDDAASLEIVADQLAAAIINARLFEVERQRTRRIATINQIGRLITSSLSLDEIVTTAAEAIAQQLHFAHVAFGIADPADPEQLILLAQAGTSNVRVPNGYRQSIHTGLVGAAARTRQRIVINDVASDPRYVAVPGASAIRAELVAPIIIGERLLGVLNIESELPISDADAEGVQIIADQLAVTMDNARRYENEKRRTERLELIARVGQRIAAHLDRDELFATTAEELHHQLGYDHAAIFLLDPDDRAWLVKRANASRWPGNPNGYRQSIERGIMGAAARQRQPVLVNDVSTDSRYVAIPGSDELLAELAMPIVLGEQLVGVIDIAGVQRLAAEDVTAIQIIGDQLAVAIENARLFSDTQRTLGVTRLLYETSRRISTAMSLEAVIGAYLEQIAARGRYACSVVLHDADSAGQWVGATIHGVWSPETGLNQTERRTPYSPEVFTPALDAGQTILIADVFSDPRASAQLRAGMAADRRTALALIPLMVRGQRIGVVSLVSRQAHTWSEADLQPYQITAAQLAAAIDSRRQYLLLAERGQELAVLEERRRLARELHDSVTQSLFSMSLLAQVLPDLWDNDPTEARASLGQIRDLTRTALAEMRALLFELRPAALGKQGLAHALREHLTSFERRAGIPVVVDVTGDPALPEPVEQAFFRIAQEALANVARHAQARRIRVILGGRTPVRLQIADDGQGFQPERVGDGRFGLVSMYERAAAVGARLQVRSASGQGTEIVVEWPNPDRDEHDPDASDSRSKA